MKKIVLSTMTMVLSLGLSTSLFANGCVYEMGFTCPPTEDPQSFVQTLFVQFNGGVGAGASCPPVDSITFDWGDGTNNAQWFPAKHTYALAGTYTITGRAFLDGAQVATNSCVVSIPQITCTADSDCDDGLFCTGAETCVAGACTAVSSYAPADDGCAIRQYFCDDVSDQYVDYLSNNRCPEYEVCMPSGDCGAVYSCDGFHSPFDAPMSVKKKSNRALPLRFNLFDSYGMEVTELVPPPIVEVRVSTNTGSDIAGWDGELLPPGLSDDSNEFVYDMDSGQWMLNLGMKAYSASTTYTISVTAGDSSYLIDGCTQTFTRQN